MRLLLKSTPRCVHSSVAPASPAARTAMKMAKPTPSTGGLQRLRASDGRAWHSRALDELIKLWSPLVGDRKKSASALWTELDPSGFDLFHERGWVGELPVRCARSSLAHRLAALECILDATILDGSHSRRGGGGRRGSGSCSGSGGGRCGGSSGRDSARLDDG